MGGDPDDEVRWYPGPDIFRFEPARWQMYAVSSCRHRHVGPAVDQDPATGGAREADDSICQTVKLIVGKVLLADLYEVYTP